MAFSPPEYCRLFAQKKAYQGGVTAPQDPSHPSYAPDYCLVQARLPAAVRENDRTRETAEIEPMLSKT